MKVAITGITQPTIPNHKTCEYMTAEEFMIYNARVSSPDNRDNHESAPKLLKYLIDHKHWSPFEMVSIQVEIETSRAMGREILRHRSASFQEFSQRYSPVVEFEPIELRYSADENRQSSSEVYDDDNSVHGLHGEVENLLIDIRRQYTRLLSEGIAKETARMILPECTRTTIVMSGSLRTYIHFFEQRCSDNAQKEIRDIAFEIREKMSNYFPWTAEALGWS